MVSSALAFARRRLWAHRRWLLQRSCLSTLIAAAGISVSGYQSWIVPSDQIQQAEARGAVYQGGEKGPQQLGFDVQIDSGAKDRKCVEVGDGDIVQSGDLVAGSFRFFGSHWQLNGARKLWWMPRYLPASQARRPLLVEATALDRPGAVTAYRRDAMVRGDRGQYFFNTDFGLPEAGRWLIVATSGPNWGCFVVVVR